MDCFLIPPFIWVILNYLYSHLQVLPHQISRLNQSPKPYSLLQNYLVFGQWFCLYLSSLTYSLLSMQQSKLTSATLIDSLLSFFSSILSTYGRCGYFTSSSLSPAIGSSSPKLPRIFIPSFPTNQSFMWLSMLYLALWSHLDSFQLSLRRQINWRSKFFWSTKKKIKW